MSASGPRCGQGTAATLGAHDVSLGDGLCSVVEVVGVDITPGKGVGGPGPTQRPAFWGFGRVDGGAVPGMGNPAGSG